MDLVNQLDPQLSDLVETYGRFELADAAPAPTPAAGAGTALSDEVVRRDVVVPGDPDVMIRVHRPAGVDGPLACIVSMHPGGYVLGDMSWDDRLFDDWCPRLSVTGVSVDYRLSPTTPYPGPLMDCYTALKWVYENAAELGIDPLRIGLHGIGAGGGLAAALALVARDHREVPLAFQMLDSPMLDDHQQTLSSRLPGLAIWSSRSSEAGWKAYLGDLHGTEDVPMYAAAARCENLRRLPPTFVSVGSLDGFHDEDVAYATRLNQTGIPTELHVYPGAPHGYHLAGDSDVARRSAADKLSWLRRHLAP